MPYERPNIQALEPYVPGEQPDAPSVIKLNTNENPYPPPPPVMEAVAEVAAEALRRYPAPTAPGFRAAAAEAHEVDPEQFIATNGGDELLRLAITVFCEPSGREGAGEKSGEASGGASGDASGGKSGGLGLAEPSYSLYHTLAHIHHTPVTAVDLDDAFDLPADLAEKWNAAGCHLGMVVSPHAPSGRTVPTERLRAIAEAFRGVLLVDEAYVDFAGTDALELIRGDRAMANVLILRSLSKGYSLAGLRFGYGLGPASLIAVLHKARDSYNVDCLAQAAATAALRHRKLAAWSWQQVIEQRAMLTEALRGRGMHVADSAANFILATLEDEATARGVYEGLKQQGILVRYFDQPRLRDKLRITVGTAGQNEALLEAIDSLRSVT